jgi:hypothetical protein
MEYYVRLTEQTKDKRDAYKTKLQSLPFPEFYVLYNGAESYPERSWLKLSDTYGGVADLVKNPEFRLECYVDVININKGKNKAIVEKCETLNGYVTLVYYIREFLGAGFGLEESLKRAIERCIEESILKK